MYLPLGTNLLKAWDISHIQPDKRVAPSASVEARKIKRGIARRHLEHLCRYEEELFKRVDHDAVDAIYNQLGLPMPMPVKAMDKEKRNKGTDAVTESQHNADYEMIQLARSRFHPVKEIREQAAANLVLIERQEIEKWKKNAADWGTATAYCDVLGTTDVNDSEWTGDDLVDNSNDTSDADSEWPDDDDSDEKEEEEEEDQAQWVEDECSRDEAEDQQIASSETHQATDDKPYECATCDLFSGFTTPPPSEMSSPPSSRIFAMGKPISDTVCSGNSQEDPSEKSSHATNELAMVLNDKRILVVYLDSIEKGIKEARKTKAEKNIEREKARQYYAGPLQRPKQARGQGRRREREERQGPAEEEKPLRWFEYEKTHIYNDLSSQWELTVERRGRNYRLARETSTEAPDRTKEKTRTLGLGVGNEDWDTDTVPDWAGASGPGWFD